MRFDELGEELGLGHGGTGEGDIGRQVLDQDLALQRVLHELDIARDDRQRLLVVAERQEVVEIGAVGDAPGEMLGDQIRLEAFADLAQPLQMIAVEAGGAAERQADAVHRQRIGLAQAFRAR